MEQKSENDLGKKEYAKYVSVGALTLVIGITSIWLLLSGAGWVGSEIVLYFGGNIFGWSRGVLGSSLAAVGVEVIFLVAVVLLIVSVVVKALAIIGFFVLAMWMSRKQPDNAKPACHDQ